MQKSKRATYTNTNFEQIATAIGTAVKPVADLEAQLEAAALWFHRAYETAAELGEVGKLTVRKGHFGGDAVNDWIASMFGHLSHPHREKMNNFGAKRAAALRRRAGTIPRWRAGALKINQQ